jgi:hypothetical protein
MQISNDAKLNMADGAYKDLPDVGMAKPHVAMPHLHHLTRQSAWNNYWPPQ